MSNDKFRVVITGASSEGAKSLRGHLPETIFKNAKVKFLDQEDIEGTLLEYDSGVDFIKKMTLESFDKVDLAFFCGDNENTKKTISLIEEEYKDQAPVMINLSCPFTPGNMLVTLDNLPTGTALSAKDVINIPNPLSTGIAILLDIVNRIVELDSVNISAQIPVSELGNKGILELQNQMVELINHGEIPSDDFGLQLIFNQIPAFGKSAADKPTDFESDVLQQVNFLLGYPDFNISLATNLAPVFFSFSVDVFLTFKEAPALSRIKSAFEKLDGFSVCEDSPLPGPIQATKSEDFQITRIISTDDKNNILISLSFDNIYTSSVKQAISIAEELFREHELLK